jgi:hypothetical protein
MDNDTQKPPKTIHPLFNLLNFLYSTECLPFDLSHLDKLILIGLFKHLVIKACLLVKKH